MTTDAPELLGELPRFVAPADGWPPVMPPEALDALEAGGWHAPPLRAPRPARPDDHEDDAPVYVEPNRHERRAGAIRGKGFRGVPDLPWVGPIPNVGRALGRLRRAAQNRYGRPGQPWHTPVRVDVVPVIHQRAARGQWSARWSGCRVVAIECHHTFAPRTVVESGAIQLQVPAVVVVAEHWVRRGPPSVTACRQHVSARPAKARAPEFAPPGLSISHFESRLVSHRIHTGAVRVPRYTRTLCAPR